MYLASSISQAWWLALLGGIVGGYLVFRLTRRRFEPFAVKFYVNLFKVLPGLGMISVDEFREYNGASVGLYELEPMRQIVYRGIKAVVIGLCDGGRKSVVHWTQTNDYSVGFNFTKDLEMLPRDSEFRVFRPEIIVRQQADGYVVGISVVDSWWQAHKHDEEIKKFVIGVIEEVGVVILILAALPFAMFRPFYGAKSVFFWDKQMRRVARIAQTVGLKEWDGPGYSYSNDFVTVSFRFLHR